MNKYAVVVSGEFLGGVVESRCDPDPRYATYAGEVRAQAVRDLLHEAQQCEREGLPLSAAVYRRRLPIAGPRGVLP